MGLVFLVEKLGTVFQMAVSIRGATDGPALGLFVLGILVPWSNTKGAMLGGCFGLLSMFWLVAGTQWHIAHGRIKHDTLPTSTDGCSYPWNETISMATMTTPAPTNPDEEPMILFQISFIYYIMIGAMITIIVGVIASYFIGMDLESVNPDHITPIMRRYVRGKNAI